MLPHHVLPSWRGGVRGGPEKLGNLWLLPTVPAARHKQACDRQGGTEFGQFGDLLSTTLTAAATLMAPPGAIINEYVMWMGADASGGTGVYPSGVQGPGPGWLGLRETPTQSA